MNYFLRHTFIFFLSLIFLTQPVWADDIRISAKVNRTQVSLGESLQFSIVVEGTQNTSPFTLPEIADFNVQYMGPARNISIVNGSYSSSVTFNYSFVPTKEGTLTIPSMQVVLDNETYTTDAIQIQVGTSASQNASEGETLRDKIFLELRIPKQEVYINEPIALKVFLYTADVQVTDIQYPTLDNVGFTEEDFDKPRQYQQTIQGRTFNIVEFNKTIYPTRIGSLTLGPATLGSSLVTPSSSSRRNNLFNDPFFSSFFGRQEKRPMTLSSNEIKLNVIDLPEEGRPEKFSGAVGQYSFDVELGPSSEIQVGDPLTLKMKVGGKGNLQSAGFPAVQQADEFKLYDPNISERPGLKEYEQVLIPTSIETKSLDPLTFVYFDPNSGRYETVTKGPFPLKVLPPKEGEGLKIVGFDQSSKTVMRPDKIGQDIIFIHEDPGVIRKKGRHIYDHILYWIFVCVTFMVFVAAYIFYQRSHRLAMDSEYARAYHAPKAARANLEKTRMYAEAQDVKQFYDAVFKTLQDYLSARCALPAGSITVENVREKMGIAQNSEVLLNLEKLFQECEMVRYASGSVSSEQMKDVLNRLEGAIESMEHILS